jgi:hypothetical protein
LQPNKRKDRILIKHFNFDILSLTSSYIIDHGVVYLCICERNYPRKLAFTYLDDLSKEFFMSYGNEIDRPGLRPYAFARFGKDFVWRSPPHPFLFDWLKKHLKLTVLFFFIHCFHPSIYRQQKLYYNEYWELKKKTHLCRTRSACTRTPGHNLT